LEWLTREELTQQNGIGEARAHIAYKGKIYDVTHSFLWQKGRHQVLHRAGQDLTRSLDEAPHGTDLLDRFAIVGMLVEGHRSGSGSTRGSGSSHPRCVVRPVQVTDAGLGIQVDTER
jgi:predicted heme/steroid binding protein